MRKEFMDRLFETCIYMAAISAQLAEKFPFMIYFAGLFSISSVLVIIED